jgi:uncharacterized LabA/DUF88 family protein
MLEKLDNGRTFVFIDAANLEKSVKDLRWKVHYRRLRAYFRNVCDLQGTRFYSVSFGSASHNEFLDSLRSKGYRVITKPLKVIKDKHSPEGEHRKANFDVEIAVDAMEYIDAYDTIILFSGDSDFDYLLKKLRDRGKYTIVVSTKYHISKELIRSSHRYIDPKKLKENIARQN